MSTVLEDTDGCANQYRYSLAIYLMAALSYLFVIIMDHKISATGHGKNFFMLLLLATSL